MRIRDVPELLLASRWISGPRIEDAIKITHRFNKRGAHGMINFLGEGNKSKTQVTKTVDEYILLLKEIKKSRINACISIKPTQIGLLIGCNEAIKNYSKIVEYAKKYHIDVWLDMEEYQYVNSTIKIYYTKIKYPNTGICIQSYLKRSINDVQKISLAGGRIRLVKGAYKESRSISYPKRALSTKNYVLLMEYLFKNSKNFIIATHDINMVSKAKQLSKIYNNRKFSYAMLCGIRNKDAIKLALAGNNVYIYIPYGTQWIKYAKRRLKEMSNLKLIIRSLFSMQTI